MKSEWQEYLRSLGMEDPLVNRVKEIIALYARLGFVAKRLFVSEYVNDDGRRNYQAVVLLDEHGRIAEASNFLQNTEYDVVSLKGKWTHFGFTKKEFDLAEATDASRMSVRLSVGAQFAYFDLRASGANCEQLTRFLVEVIASDAQALHF